MSPSLGATNKSYLSPPVGATNTPQTYLIRLLQWSPQTCYSSPSMGATHSFVCHQHLMTTTKTSQHPWINKALNNLIARLDQDDLCRNQLCNDSPTGDKCQPQKASNIFTWNNCRIRKRKLCAHLTPLPTGLEGSCGNCPLIQPSLGNLHAWPLHSELLGKGWAGMKRALLRNYRNVKSLLWNRLQIGGEIYQMLDFIHLFNSPQPEILFKIIWASNETKPHCVFLKLKSKPFFLNPNSNCGPEG